MSKPTGRKKRTAVPAMRVFRERQETTDHVTTDMIQKNPSDLTTQERFLINQLSNQEVIVRPVMAF